MCLSSDDVRLFMLDVGKVVILKNGCEYTEEQPQCSGKSCYCTLGRLLIFIGPSKRIGCYL